MAEFSQHRARAVAIELKEKALDAYIAFNAVYAEISTWTLHCAPSALPTPFDIRMALEQYDAAKNAVKPLQLTDWKTELLEAEYADTLTDRWHQSEFSAGSRRAGG